MTKKLILLLFVFAFLISLTSATEFVFQEESEVDVKVLCFNNGYCSSSAFCNISIFYPDNTILIDEVTMTNQNSYHNYTISSNTTTQNGEYDVVGFCNDGGLYDEVDFFFTVTPNGELPSTSKGLMGITLLLLLSTFFILSLVGLFKIEDYKGRFALYWVSHLLFVAVTFIAWQMSSSYLFGTPFITSFFRILFLFTTIGIFPMVILSMSWIFYIHLMNDDIKKLMDRGMDEGEAHRRRGGKR